MRAATFTAILVATLAAFSAVASAEYAPTPPVPGSLPADAVALVESTPITKQAFDHAYDVNVKFAGSTKERSAARKAALTSLIDAVRTRIEANALGIVVSDATVIKRFNTLKKQSFPKARDYKRFLAEFGQTEADLIELVRAAMYKERLQAKWVDSVTVTDQEVIDEYNAHPRSYGTPASRDLLLIFNKKRQTIYKALAALKRGRSFERVAAKYSADVTRKTGGSFPGVTKGQFPSTVDRAIFKAKRGKLIGPLKTGYGYYLVRITHIHKSRARTLEEARDDVYETVMVHKQREIEATGLKAFDARWKPATLCRTGYVAKVCGSYAG